MSILARLAPKDEPPLFPFDEPARALPLLDVPLAEHQAREAQRAGLKLVDVAAGEVAHDETVAACSHDAVFTAETLAALVEEGRRRGALLRAAIRAGTPLHAFAAPFIGASGADLPLPLVAGPLGGRSVRETIFDEAELFPLCDEEESEDVRVAPYGPPPHLLRVPKVERLGGRLAHWLHLLNLNQALLVTERARRGALAGGVAIDGDVQAHPTALVEGSILKGGVEIEHSATVIGSYLGEGVRVGDHAVIVGCVIGKGCHTLVDTHLRRVVALPGSTLSNLGTSDLLLGREVFLTTGVAFFEDGPAKNAVIDGEDARRPLVSGAIGNRCVLGARALFAAGVALPSGTIVVMRPDEGLAKLDERGLRRAQMQIGDPAVDV